MLRSKIKNHVKIFVLTHKEVNMKRKLLYNDGCMYSDYYFMDDVVVIRHNDCGDDNDTNLVCVCIDKLREIIQDYDSNYGVDNE